MRGPQRYIQLVGGARAGKTLLIVRQILERARKYPGSRHVSLRLRRNHAWESLWLDTIPKVMELCFPGMKQRCKLNHSDGYIKLWNNSEYWIGGLDDKERVDKILGKEFATVHYNETSQIPYSSVLKVRTRLAQKIDGLKNREYHDLNPVGKMHWSHLMFSQLIDPLMPETALDPALYATFQMNPRDNAENLDEEFIRSLDKLPPAMRARFFLGEYQDEMQFALWTLAMLAGCHGDPVTPQTMPPMRRIVIGVDPSGSAGDAETRADDIGILVCGMGIDNRGYLLEDATLNGSPRQWASAVKEMRVKWNADKVVAERNFGGEMVLEVLRNVDPNTPAELVTSSRSKALRAEPVSIMYEHERVVHCGDFHELQQEMVSVKAGDTTDEIKLRLGRSPNRLDAMVFAFTELFGLTEHGIFEMWKDETEEARNPKPRPLGPKVEDTTPIPFVDQAKAATQEVGGVLFEADSWREKPKTRPKPVCSQCQSETVREYAETWQCGECGATGQIA